MDRLIREANPPPGQLASPKPQYKKPGVDGYEPVEGQHGAPFAILKDASGNIVSPATEDKLEQVRQLLVGVATEAKLEQVKSELELVKSELQTIKTNQTSGDQKVQLSGTLTELFGKSLSDRPPANSVSVGATFMVVGDTVVYQSNGTDWVVISE